MEAAAHVLAQMPVQVLILMMCLFSLGCVYGLERTLLLEMAQTDFPDVSHTGKLGIVVTFGLSKAIANGAAGVLCDKIGRKWLCVGGLALGIPVPVVFVFAPAWSVVVAINLLYGASQGLAASAIVVMLIDLLGDGRRGVAVGILECTLYVTVALWAFLGEALIQGMGVRDPFWIAAGVGALGVAVSLLLRDTRDRVEAEMREARDRAEPSTPIALNDVEPEVEERTVDDEQQQVEPHVLQEHVKRVLSEEDEDGEECEDQTLSRLGSESSTALVVPEKRGEERSNDAHVEKHTEDVVGASSGNGGSVGAKEALVSTIEEGAFNGAQLQGESVEGVSMQQSPGEADNPSVLQVIVWCLLNPSVMACIQAGMINNVKDGVMWGVLEDFMVEEHGMGHTAYGAVQLTYTLTWGVTQLFTGALSDRVGRKGFMVAGLLLQAVCMLMIPLIPLAVGGTVRLGLWFAACFALGFGTAMVYPVFQAAVGDAALPLWRAQVIGIYRFSRDMGYVFGAIGSGLVADLVSLPGALYVTGALLAVSCTWMAIAYGWRARPVRTKEVEIEMETM